MQAHLALKLLQFNNLNWLLTQKTMMTIPKKEMQKKSPTPSRLLKESSSPQRL